MKPAGEGSSSAFSLVDLGHGPEHVYCILCTEASWGKANGLEYFVQASWSQANGLE